MGTYLVGATSSYEFRARIKTELWSMAVEQFRSISAHHKKKQLALKAEFLKRVKVKGRSLGKIVENSEIDALALASRSESYNTGGIIV